MTIIDLIGAEKLRRLTVQYADAFGVPVFVFGKGKELLSASAGEDPGLPETAERPVVMRGSVAGYVAVPLSDSRGESHLALIADALSGMAEAAYEMDSLSAEVARNYAELSLLWKFSSKIGACLNADTICRVLVDEVMGICPSKNISILLEKNAARVSGETGEGSTGTDRVTDDEGVLTARVAVGDDAAKAASMRLSRDRGLVGLAFKRREALTVCDVSKDNRFEGLPFAVANILIVPLVAEGAAIGVIVASSKLSGEEYFSTEIKLIDSIAAESAISIKKAFLFEEVRTTLFSTVEAFAFAIEAKDRYTFGHSKRVSRIAVDIAKKMGLLPDRITWIQLAALLHDIGKIGTPENILNKSGELSIDEREKIREHPLTGARMLEGLPRMKEIAVWISHHHERYDGSGYPNGVKGDDIPLAAKIISLADNFDALTSDRSYRDAYGRDEAIQIMRQDVGVRFDPALFGYLCEVV